MSRARCVAKRLLADDVPRGWVHVQQVTSITAAITRGCSDYADAVAAAWLHDIGYAPAAASTGCHPLDGARYVRALDLPDSVAGLVAFPSCARVEAAQRGCLGDLEAEFIDVASLGRDALWAADATTGPEGRRVSLDARLAEIATRYGADHLITQCSRTIASELAAAIARSQLRAPHAFAV